jgi:sulfur-oxidizing protein SoxA
VRAALRRPAAAFAAGIRAAVRAAIGVAANRAAIFVVVALACAAPGPASATDAVRPSRDFLSPELRAQQDDPSRHPGWLWVDQGETLWRRAPAPGTPSCEGCHGGLDAMRGVATRLPAVDADGALTNLEGRINRCVTQRQGRPALAWESDALLALTAAIAQRSRGMPMAVAVDGPAAPFLERGRELYRTRQGQLNLSCTQCHDERAGLRLRGDRISSGLGTGYPAYRLEWNGMGSLHRRLRACSLGVRATQFAPGSDEYLALELWLAHRARGLPVEAPGLRR